MNNNDFEKSKNEVKKLKNYNIETVLVNDEKSRLLKANGLDSKVETTLMFSSIGAVLLNVLSTTQLPSSFGYSTIASAFSGVSYPIFLVGGSLAIGSVARIALEKKFRIKERLNAFSKAHTRSEKLEEEIYYQVEKEKANNRNKVINVTVECLNNEQMAMDDSNNKYDLNNKNLNSKKEIESELDDLSNQMNKKYNELDVLTAQKVLFDKFYKINKRSSKITQTLIVAVLGALFTLIAVSFPTLIIINKALVTSTSSLVIASLSLPVLSVIASSVYMAKKNKDYANVFEKLNCMLGNNTLKKSFANCYENPYNELINQKINDISSDEVQIQENKRLLDKCIFNNKDEVISKKTQKSYAMNEHEYKNEEIVDKSDIKAKSLIKKR